METFLSLADSDWLEVCTSLGISSQISTQWWRIIADYYGENHRFYHTLEHISFMLEQLKTHCQGELIIKNTNEVKLAIFFHDVTYNPKTKDNEKQSALLAMKFCEEAVPSSCDINKDKIYDMILLTEDHKTPAHSKDHQFGTDDIHYLLDIDMSILGQEWQVYEKYAADIRREYSHIPHNEYCQRRAQVLTTFLDTDRVYCTLIFHTLYEMKARVNINKEVTLLKENIIPSDKQ